MMRSKRFAVTGGIGSGKSQLCEILREMGYPVFSCDEIYFEMRGEAEYLALLAQRFPDCVTGGKLDAKALSRRVFSSEGDRKVLNELSHPRVMARLMECMAPCEVSFAEVPLLYEGGFEGMFDGVVAVVRDKTARVAAVAARDGLSEEDILARMAAQTDERVYRERGAYIVVNDGSLDELRDAAREMTRFYKIDIKKSED